MTQTKTDTGKTHTSDKLHLEETIKLNKKKKPRKMTPARYGHREGI